MKRRTVITMAGSLALPVARAMSDQKHVVLISREQVELEQRWHAEHAAEDEDEAHARRRGLFPVIRVIAPKDDAADLLSPLRLEFSFETSRDARIVPATFRMLYGLMKFDLTETLRREATITEHGLTVERAVVPPGTHRLLLQIADDRGRVNEQTLRLRVLA